MQKKKTNKSSKSNKSNKSTGKSFSSKRRSRVMKFNYLRKTKEQREYWKKKKREGVVKFYKDKNNLRYREIIDYLIYTRQFPYKPRSPENKRKQAEIAKHARTFIKKSNKKREKKESVIEYKERIQPITTGVIISED